MRRKPKAFILLLIILLLSGLACYLGYKDASGIRLGLDLNGGVSITYRTEVDNPTTEQLDDTVYKLQLKAQSYSTEAQVYKEGTNRINIDIPGATDANEILAELGEPGTLEFTDQDGNVLLTGNDVKSATEGMTSSQNGGSTDYVIELIFNDEGSRKFAEATAENVGKPLFIIYNNEIVSYPTVREAITGGQAQITGINDYESAKRIASTIRIGALPLKLTELRSNVIGATLGQQAISTSLKAAAVGIALVMVFMIAIYLLPGFCASLALILYVGLELLALEGFEATLTLPGIAGIILSIGMAVDANVIIFTRIKEEIGLGRSVEDSIRSGYRKALSAILDGNITTLIAAAVLYIRGSGTVKGFATTLAIGIVISLITALFITRALMWCFFNLGLSSKKLYGIRKDIKIRNFVYLRRFSYIISIAMIVIGFVFIGINKSSTMGSIFNYDLDFQGGSSTNITFNSDLSMDEIDAKVVPVFSEVIQGNSSVNASKVAGTTEVIIKTRTLTTEERISLYDKLVQQFAVDETKITTENISGAISSEMKQDAVWALIIAIIFMLLYIWFRFKDIKFASASVVALAHDVLVTITFYAMLRWAVGSTFIACILTIVGYSINATIVIFDRIRENLRLPGGRANLENTVNRAISETLTRSINTSLTTFVTVFCLFIFGVSAIRDFTLPLMVGIISGAWSSIMVAGPLWYDLTKLVEKRRANSRNRAREETKDGKETKEKEEGELEPKALAAEKG